MSGTTQVSRYQKGKTNLDFTEATDSECQRHQLGHMQVCTSFQTDNHASTSPLSFLQAGCPSCHPTNSVKALKAQPKQWSKKVKKDNATEPPSCVSYFVMLCMLTIYIYSQNVSCVTGSAHLHTNNPWLGLESNPKKLNYTFVCVCNPQLDRNPTLAIE